MVSLVVMEVKADYRGRIEGQCDMVIRPRLHSQNPNITTVCIWLPLLSDIPKYQHSCWGRFFGLVLLDLVCSRLVR